MINEKQNISNYEYRKVIEDILNYIEVNKISSGTIPQYLYKDIDYLENLTIYIIPNTKNSNTDFSKTKKIENKLHNVIINIGYSSIEDIRASLYHELNHIYELYIYSVNNLDIRKYKKGSFSPNIIHMSFTKDEELNTNLNIIFYRFFSNTEFHSFINGIYGELKNNPNIHCFNDVKNTYHYIEYQKYLNIFHNLRQIFNDINIKSLKIFMLFILKINLSKYSNGEIYSYIRKRISYCLNKIDRSFKKLYYLSISEHYHILNFNEFINERY